MMISWWSKHVGVVLSVLIYDIWINVLFKKSALVGKLHKVAYFFEILPNVSIDTINTVRM
jgi:hypothetical protein